MAVVGYFPATLAVDSNTGTRLRNAEAQVFAISDTSFSAPLAITDIAGVPFTGGTLVSNSDGIYPEFKPPAGVTQVIVKSGQALTPMTSVSVAAEAAEDAALAAAGAASEATSAASAAASSAGEAAEAAGAAAAVGATTDAQIESRIKDPASLTAAALNTAFVGVPEGITAGQVPTWDGSGWVAGDGGGAGVNWVFAGTSSSSTSQGYGLAVGDAVDDLVGFTPTIERIGVAGQTSNQALSALRARIATGVPIAVALIQMTPNDGRVNGQGISQTTTAANYRKMYALARAAGAIVVLTTATPIDIAQYGSANYTTATVATQLANNQMLRDLAAEDGVDAILVDLYDTFQYRTGFLADGLHLNSAGDVIAGAVVAAKVLGFPDPYPPEQPWETVIADDFNRANGALGSTSTGSVAWAETSATPPYIESNRMRANNNGQLASVATGVSTFEVSASIIAGSQTRAGVIIAVDANNYLYWGTPSNTSARLYKTIAGGTATQIGQSNTIAWADGQSHALAARVQGNTIRLYIDGVLVETYTLSTDEATTFNAAQRGGIRINGNSLSGYGYADDFAIKVPAA